MRSQKSLIVFLNTFLILFFLLMLTYSSHVEAARPLGGQSLSSLLSEIVLDRAYSGPSHRGRGH
ncbi:hypothetical protein ACJRO7_027417 [Eucalyptus globulus]|uniref:Transmembrane protein n=1 Tax=Eucalyptus globulus TaxID=34317 RepID=A0ABD3JR78_EUCGL